MNGGGFNNFNGGGGFNGRHQQYNNNHRFQHNDRKRGWRHDDRSGYMAPPQAFRDPKIEMKNAVLRAEGSFASVIIDICMGTREIA